MSSKILVIGTNGFLGKHIKGLFEKEKESIFEIQGKSQVDLTREEEIESYLSQNSIEKIINCSAFVGGISYGYKFPVEMLVTNTQMTINLYNAASRNGVQHIVNPISNCAYPGNLEVYKEENFWEGPPHSSVFYYGLSRRNIVAISSSFQQQYSLETSNVVLSNMYGPKDHFDIDRSHALGALVKKVCDAKMNDENEVEIWGSGEPIREWLYVEDGARALIKSLELNKPHQLFNVGINEGISIKDLAHKILSEVDWSGEFKFDVSKPDGVKRKTVDGSLGQELLQWTPGIDIDTGIKMTVDWYMSNHE
jgi:GDP-L-fucose synthase